MAPINSVPIPRNRTVPPPAFDTAILFISVSPVDIRRCGRYGYFGNSPPFVVSRCGVLIQYCTVAHGAHIQLVITSHSTQRRIMRSNQREVALPWPLRLESFVW